MNKTIIANWGGAQQGKSDTIKRVTKLILHNNPKATYEPFDFKFDIKTIIYLRDNIIGIESTGDPNSRLPGSLNYFVKNKCDIILCSTRSRGSTVQAVDDLAIKYGYNVIWVTNHRSNEFDHVILNQMSSEFIYKVFETVLKNKLLPMD